MGNKKVCWIYLSLIFGVGNPQLLEYVSHFENIADACENVGKHPDSFQFLCDKNNSHTSPRLAEDINDFCCKNKIEVVCFDDENYPEKLKFLNCPPAVLYCLGDIKRLENKSSVAVVGARRSCSYSLKVAQLFSSELVQNNVTIISGFAKGIDTAAHLGAISSDGCTAAVLGCGILYDYPKGSMQLKKDIARNGVVISEFPPLTKPEPQFFKIRNRIISGLSDAVLCVEAGAKSGSLNTVAHGLEQGREIFVIPPHNILDSRFAGQTSLLLDGAAQVYSVKQILACIK